MDPVADSATAAFLSQVDRLLGSLLLRIRRCAVSSALREDADIACALCDADGRSLIERGGNPVLRGALSAQVRAILAQDHSAWSLSADQALIANSESLPTPSSEPAAKDREPVVREASLWAGFVDRQTFALLVPLVPPAAQPEAAASSVSLRVLYLALGARFPRAPFGSLPSAEAGLCIDALAPAVDSELANLPPAVGPRYLPFAPPPPAAPPRLQHDEGSALSATVIDERSLPAILRRTSLCREAQSDLLALHACLLQGRKALSALLLRIGWDQAQAQCRALYEQTAQATQRLLSALPAGFYAFADSLDEDGCGATDLALRATLLLRRDEATLDLCDSADAAAGPLNLSAAASVAVVKEAVYRLLHTLDGNASAHAGRLPPSDALCRGLTLRLRRGSIVAAESPSAHALACDETAQRLMDVLQGVFAQVLPSRVAAGSAGTRSAVYVAEPPGVQGTARAESLAERRIVLPGGLGAQPEPGAFSGALFPAILPSIEALEASVPVRVQTLALRPDSAGLGLRSGEPGWHRALVFLRPQQVTLAGERRRRPPYGLAGGGPAATGQDVLQRDRAMRKLPAKAILHAQAGDVVETESPGGAGHGDAQRAAFFASLFDGGS